MGDNPFKFNEPDLDAFGSFRSGPDKMMETDLASVEGAAEIENAAMDGMMGGDLAINDVLNSYDGF